MATLAVAPAISVEQYLNSTYEHDVDYVDGHVEERDLGEWEHNKLQKLILLALAKGEDAGHYLVIQEQRVQVSPSRFRIPDTCVISDEDEPERIITKAPLLCIEVLSPEDTYRRLHAKCQDYLRMGVPEVWIFDPETLAVDVLRNGMTMHHEGVVLKLDGTALELDVAALRQAMPRKNPFPKS